MTFYHGTESDHLIYSPYGGQSDEPEMLFASASYEFASRFGRQVFALELASHVESLPCISLSQWLDGSPLPEGSFIIQVAQGEKDFPADTLVVRHAEDIRIHPQLKRAG